MTEIITNQDQALAKLREDITNMMDMVHIQLEKAKFALETIDTGLASEIIHIEKRVNATELRIDKECENIFALFNPVAVDLRFVLAVLSINTHLERIGDHAEGIAEYIERESLTTPFETKLMEDIRFDEMFTSAISMVDDAILSFINEDSAAARSVFLKDSNIDKINRKSADIIAEFSAKKPEKINKYLYLFSIVKKIERIGDLAKNIAEETIFFIDAKYVKHKDKKVKDKHL